MNSELDWRTGAILIGGLLIWIRLDNFFVAAAITLGVYLLVEHFWGPPPG